MQIWKTWGKSNSNLHPLVMSNKCKWSWNKVKTTRMMCHRISELKILQECQTRIKWLMRLWWPLFHKTSKTYILTAMNLWTQNRERGIMTCHVDLKTLETHVISTQFCKFITIFLSLSTRFLSLKMMGFLLLHSLRTSHSLRMPTHRIKVLRLRNRKRSSRSKSWKVLENWSNSSK